MGDAIEISDTLDDQIAAAIRDAVNAPAIEKISHLKRAEELLLNRDGAAHLIDNFLDEMLEFAAQPQVAIKCFVVNFIERAWYAIFRIDLVIQAVVDCESKKDAEVMKKAVTTLSFLMMADGETNVQILKKVMSACTNIYPVVIRWAVLKKSDADVEACWDKFGVLKGRIMFHTDSDNEGIRTMAIKFLETVVMCQSPKSDLPDVGSKDTMNLNDIPRDHRYISYRKMQSEAQYCMQSLLDQTVLPHISSQNLLTVLSVICNIARARPIFLPRVVEAIDVLQVNLPPTLGTSQVKAVRKELKMHLIRIIKHPAAVSLAQKIATLLTDLGVNQSEITKVMPVESKKRPAPKDGLDEPEPKKKRDTDVPTTSAAADEDDDDEEEDEGERKTIDSAIDVTQRYIYDRLNDRVVTNLVFISLATLPDEMPACFQSTFTPIASAGSEAQRLRLARMMATQATQAFIGPGAEMIKEQKRLAFLQRHSARTEGAIIPPTPAHVPKADKPAPKKRLPPKVTETLPPPTAKPKTQFNLVTSCKDMKPAEREALFEFTVKRIMNNEKRAMQGGAAQAQQKILIRLVTRFKEDNLKLEKLLIGFILEDQKLRSDLAQLWVAEMYAQYQGFSMCFADSREGGKFSAQDGLNRYNHVLVLLIRTLFEREEHKELLFHKILLEAPLITPDALSFLKLSCADPIYGGFGMTTLRELVMTRARQRDELLRLLFHLTFYEKQETRQQAVETVKELYELPYMRSSVREGVERQLEDCCEDLPPVHFVVDGTARVWTPQLFKSALALPVASLAQDHALIHTMAKVFARSSTNDFKLAVMRQIEGAVRAMGQQSTEILNLLDKCPLGAESLVARIVHLLTERNPASREIVTRLKRLHETRHTDVRSLLPILPGLTKDDIVTLLPKFVLNPTMVKSFGQAVKRILSTKSSESVAVGLSPVELIVEYHHIQPSTAEEKKLLHDQIRTVLTSHKSMVREAVSEGIERILKEFKPLPVLLFHTLSIVHEIMPTLKSFLTNVLQKIVERNLWKESSEHEQQFFSAVLTMNDIALEVLLTHLDAVDLEKFINQAPTVDVEGLFRTTLANLSSHHQRMVKDDVLALLKVAERPYEAKDRERDRERTKERERRERDRDRDERERRKGGREDKRFSTRRSYAIGERY